jgi:hypothetical protein
MSGQFPLLNLSKKKNPIQFFALFPRKVTNVFDTPQNKINIGFFKWSEHPVRLDTIFTTRTQPPLEFAENPLHASRHLNPTGRFYDQFAALGDSFVQKKLEFINNTT